MNDFIGRGEKLVERIINRLFLNSETHRQVEISKLILNEDFIEYGEEFSKHKCDLVMKVMASDGEIQTLVIEINYKHKEKAAKKWKIFARDISRKGNLPVTIDDYDTRSLFKQNSKKEHEITWNDHRDVIDQLEKAGVKP